MALKRYSKILLCIVLCISILLCSFTNCFAVADLFSVPLFTLPAISGTAITAAGTVAALAVAAALGFVIYEYAAPAVVNYIRGFMSPSELKNLEDFGNGTAGINAGTASTANRLVKDALANGIPTAFGAGGTVTYEVSNIPYINAIDGNSLIPNYDTIDNLNFVSSGLPYISICPVRFYNRAVFPYTLMGLLVYDSLNKNLSWSWSTVDSYAAQNSIDFRFTTSPTSDGTRVSIAPQFSLNGSFNSVSMSNPSSSELLSDILSHWQNYIPGVGAIASISALSQYYLDNAINRQYYPLQINTPAQSATGTGSISIPGTPTAEDDEEAERVPFVLPPFSLDDTDEIPKVDFLDIPADGTLDTSNTTEQPDNPDDGDDKDPIGIVGLIDKLLNTLGAIVAFLTAYTMFQALCTILPLPVATLLWAAWLAFILFMLIRLILGR